MKILKLSQSFQIISPRWKKNFKNTVLKSKLSKKKRSSLIRLTYNSNFKETLNVFHNIKDLMNLNNKQIIMST
jgi:hypothetical protein